MKLYCPCCGIEDHEWETLPSDHDPSCIWYENMQRTLYVLIGPSGSGKSTARQKLEHFIYLERQQSAMTFSLDDIRESTFSRHNPTHGLVLKNRYAAAYDWCLQNQKIFDEAVTDIWDAMLQIADSLIIDNVNNSRKSRAKWINEARSRGFKIVCVHVNTPLETIITRQKTRLDKSVPEVAVRAQYNKLEEAVVGEECDQIIVIDGTKQYTEEEWKNLLTTF